MIKLILICIVLLVTVSKNLSKTLSKDLLNNNESSLDYIRLYNNAVINYNFNILLWRKEGGEETLISGPSLEQKFDI